MRTGSATGIDFVAESLRSLHVRFDSELELQDGIEAVLANNAIPYRREVVLGPLDRIDFLCEGIGIEVKTDGSLASVTRQLHRYAQLDSIDALLLVTSRSKHRNLPTEMNHKPLRVLWIGLNGAL